MRAALLALAAAATLLAACDAGPASDEAFGRRVRAYLLVHPEVLQEAMQRLQTKIDYEEAAAARRGQALLPALRPRVERDGRDFVANPKGTITVTEFYDYRCPHCINAAPKVLALIRGQPDVRVVFKESPIFGPTSEHAARAALAVKAAGGDYLKLYETYMSARPLDDRTIDEAARRQGAIAVPAADPHLADTAALFTKLGLGGT
ncbi:MAG: DsbA family protein, partial [Caulobacteraceae bacterium]|nr:DsbA family protein [Caulobacteraceae bacterium]